MLEIRDLVVHYGAIRALNGVTLSVPEGKVVCVIGSNGAGKTTTLRTVSGLLRPTSGSITFDGASLVGQPACMSLTTNRCPVCCAACGRP